MIDIFGCLTYNATISFAQPDALKGSLAETLREVRPTGIFGVPRVWEKIMERMRQYGQGMYTVQRWIADWAKYVGLQGEEARERGEPLPWGWTVAEWCVFYPVRLRLGLDRCRFHFSGAAPLMRETFDYFASVNIPLLDIYGTSECSGPETVSLPWRLRSGSSGVPLPDTEMRVDSDTGEILIRGRNVCMGYLNDARRTQETIDANAMLHTGDVGTVDADGFLYVVGRIKELIVTAGGENIAPVPIEDAIKAEMPLIGNAMAIGDTRKCLVCLLTLKTEFDTDTGESLSHLTPAARAECARIGCAASVASAACRHPAVLDYIAAGMARVNERAVSQAARVRRWTLLPVDFSILGGELGPTLKLRRYAVLRKYAQVIEQLYSDP